MSGTLEMDVLLGRLCVKVLKTRRTQATASFTEHGMQVEGHWEGRTYVLRVTQVATDQTVH